MPRAKVIKTGINGDCWPALTHTCFAHMKHSSTAYIPALLFFCLLSLSGCMSHGNRHVSNENRVMLLREGVTTKRDAHQLIGQPHDVILLSDREAVWEYYSVQTKVSGKTLIPVYGLFGGGDNVESQTLTLIFGSDSRLHAVKRTNADHFVNTWTGLGRTMESRTANEISLRVEQEMARCDLPFDRRVARETANILVYRK